MIQLIVAEKPSVARDLARVVGARQREAAAYRGDGVLVTWCIGHMVGLCEPGEYDPAWKTWSEATLPILPATFALRPLAARRKHWTQLKRLLRDASVSEVVNACDAGREGELIFRYVYELSGCRKPVRRLWLASLTDGAVRAAMGQLRPACDYDGLARAARCRSEADWLVGLNATRALTLAARRSGAGRALLSVGRVQTPTLAMLVDRERAIGAFVPTPFWKVFARFQVEHGVYEGVYCGPVSPAPKGRLAVRGKRLVSRGEADEIASFVAEETGAVVHLDQTRRRVLHPLLYDLTSLQRETNKRFHLSAAATLSVAQELYERHKLITYPRVDSRYITRDMVGGLKKILGGVGVGPYRGAADAALARGAPPVSRRWVDDSKVRDHHAIIPTGKTPDLEKLSANALRVYDLIVRRFLAVFSDAAVFGITDIVTQVGPHQFATRGRVTLEAGWQAVDPRHRVSGDAPLPHCVVNEAAAVAGVRVHQAETEPPPRYTEGALLAAMERAGAELEEEDLRRSMKGAGLGTPATRANVIETLLTRRYVRRERKALVPTPEGIALIDSVDTPALKSPRLTAQWESRLAAIAQGELGEQGRRAFMDDVRGFVRDVVASLKTAQGVKVAAADTVEVLGKCPVCGTGVRASHRAYVCETGRDCSFVIFKQVAGRKISPALVQVLLSGRRSKRLKGFRSRKGKRFQAALALDALGRVALCFDPPGETPRATVACPVCREGQVIRGRRGWGCSRWKAGCQFVVLAAQYGQQLDERQVLQMITTGRTGTLTGLAGPGGTALDGHLVLDLEAPTYVRIGRSVT